MMMMQDFANIQDRLRTLLPTLPKKLRAVATYMLDKPGDIATLPMRKLAENADVAMPNFDRLAKLIGYGTYGELREHYRLYVQRDDRSEYHLRARNLQNMGISGGVAEMWAASRGAALANIARVYDGLPAEQMERIVDLLIARKRIFVVGAQASNTAAQYLNYVGHMMSAKFVLLGRINGLFADDLSEITKDDAMLVISIRPCAKAAVEIAKIASERGCLVVGFTDSLAAPLARYCDEVLQTPTESPMFFESYLGTTAIIELLLSVLTMRLGDEVAPRIERIEADRHRMGEYWKDKGE